MAAVEPLVPRVPEPTTGPRRALLVGIPVVVAVLPVAGFLALRAVSRPDPVPVDQTDQILRNLGFRSLGLLSGFDDPTARKVLHTFPMFDYLPSSKDPGLIRPGEDHVYFVVTGPKPTAPPPVTSDLTSALCHLMIGSYSFATGPDYAVAVTGPSTQRVIDAQHLRDVRTIPC
jgi:hypothetical protein